MYERKLLRILPLAWFLGSCVEPKGVPGTGRMDYVVIATKALAASVQPLVQHRKAGGLNVRVALLEEIAPEKPSADALRACVREIAKASPVRFLLLVGDSPPLPTFRLPCHFKPDVMGGRFEDNVGTDSPYGDLDGDNLPDLAVGRLSARNSAELNAIVQNILAYETHPPAGEWRRTIAFFGEPGGFGGGADEIIENVGSSILSEQVPYTFDLKASYGSPTSEYFIPRSQIRMEGGRFEVSLKLPSPPPKAKAYYLRALVTAGSEAATGCIPVRKETLKTPPRAVPKDPSMELRSTGKILVTRIRVTGATRIPRAKIQNLVGPLEGKEQDFEALKELAAKIQNEYLASGDADTIVFLPAQEFRDGVVEILVKEGGK